MTVDSIFALAASLGEDSARIYKPPARRDLSEIPDWVSAVATTGGPVPKPQMPKPVGPPRFVAGEHRLVGAVWPPDGPFPGSPPGPPPDPGPQAGDGPARPGQPGPPPRPQPGPTPHPPPPRSLWLSLSLDCPTWPSSRRPTP